MARTALWQVMQLCGATAAWSKRAGVQALVVWQLSQPAVVGKWLEDLPFAIVPLWQLAQLPSTWAWSTRVTGSQARVVWQFWQASRVGMWPGGLPLLEAAL